MERWYRWGCDILKEFVDFAAVKRALVTYVGGAPNVFKCRWTCILYSDYRDFSLKRFWEQIFEKQPWSLEGQRMFRVVVPFIPELGREHEPLFGCPEFETPDDLLGFLYGITRFDAKRELSVARLLSLARGRREPESFGWVKHRGGIYAAHGLTYIWTDFGATCYGKGR